jgi:hypothetical protein
VRTARADSASVIIMGHRLPLARSRREASKAILGAVPEIHVEKLEEGEGYELSVRVSDEGSETRHSVTLSEHDFARLGTGYASAEEFVHACFGFLLAREAKEQILSKFDVSVIPRYFPEFENEIRR